MEQRNPSFQIVAAAPKNGVAANVTLTLAVQPANTETITIGSRTYTWVTAGTANANGKISVGADLAAAKVNFLAAMAGTDGINLRNEQVTAGNFSGDNSVITARNKGTAGNSLVSTETMAGVGNAFSAATLTGGVTGNAAKPGDQQFFNNKLYVYAGQDEPGPGANKWYSVTMTLVS